MTRRIWIVADDYGLSPAVDDGILELLDRGRLSGTGCMTVFPDWMDEAGRLKARHSGQAGLHLTLTDQPSLSGAATLACDGRLPSLAMLLKGIATGRIADADIKAELDAQLARFEAAFGKLPRYIDGHQHIHFLPAVRRWLKAMATSGRQPLPWLRGAPVAKYSPKTSFAKMATVRALASRFESAMVAGGFAVFGPLAGFYDWRAGDDFPPTVNHAVKTLPDQAVLMVHPGHVDQMLRSRDVLTDTRSAELRYLSSDMFGQMLDSVDAVIATP
jgi:predicted glycoside hydrolase/deacetylase ChbG (UPF0249 family)